MIVTGKLFRVLLAALTVGWGPGLCCCGPWGGSAHGATQVAGEARPASGEDGMAGGHCGDAGGGSGCHGERSAQPEPEGRASLSGAGLSGAGHDDCDCHVSAEAEEERPVYTAGPSRAVEALATAVVDFRTPVLWIDPERVERRWSGPSSGEVLPDACLTDSLVQQHTLLTT